MRARFAREIGVRGQLCVLWQQVVLQGFRPIVMTGARACGCESEHQPLYSYKGGCPRPYGQGRNAGPNVGHAAYTFIAGIMTPTDIIDTTKMFGRVDDFDEVLWPTGCKHCSALVPVPARLPNLVGTVGIQLTRQVEALRFYDTPTGDIMPGCLYYAHWLHGPKDPCMYWNNCDGRHLMAMLPNGALWDIDSRASNCTMRDDRVHRCWVRTGLPEAGDVHVSKAGLTCAAGSGSIAVAGYHGYLHNGEFVP